MVGRQTSSCRHDFCYRSFPFIDGLRVSLGFSACLIDDADEDEATGQSKEARNVRDFKPSKQFIVYLGSRVNYMIQKYSHI